jgi:hypothetical protein
MAWRIGVNNHLDIWITKQAFIQRYDDAQRGKLINLFELFTQHYIFSSPFVEY